MITITKTHEQWLFLLICLHTLIVGLILLFVPLWALSFGGWEAINQVFFARQAGIFHVVLVCAYLIEYYRYDGVSILVTAKTIAVVFLFAMAVVEPVTWAVLVSAVGDGAMAVVMWWVHRRVTQSADRN